jgi:hypothetical protein
VLLFFLRLIHFLSLLYSFWAKKVKSFKKSRAILLALLLLKTRGRGKEK